MSVSDPISKILCFLRHIELEAERKREKQVRTLKKNLKLLMIALIVLAIEKLSEFITALFSSPVSYKVNFAGNV